MTCKRGVLLVANWDSSTGYAWWLMESYWIKIYSVCSPKYSVYLAYPSISAVPKEIKSCNIVTEVIDFNKSDIFSVWKQMQYIVKRNIKLVYFSDKPLFSFKYFLYRLCGVKCIVVHEHSPGLRTRPSKPKRWLKRLVMRLSLFTCDIAIGATDYVKERIENIALLPSRKIHSCPNGIFVENYLTTKKINIHSLFGIPENRVIMVSTGRASLYKGIDFVLEVLRSLLNKHGDLPIHYLFCGDGPDLEYLINKSKTLKLESYVTFPGKCENIPQILSGCDFAIHPSKGEVGYSLSILEYMAAGLPVIVPDNPSVCGATENGHDGLIYQNGNIASASNAVYELTFNYEERIRLGKNAREKVIENYKIEKSHQKLEKIILSIL